MAALWNFSYFVLLCLLRSHLGDVDGRDLPLKYNQLIKYRTGDTLCFGLQLNDLPPLPHGQYWETTMFLKRTKTLPISTYTSNSSEQHSYNERLGPEDDGAIMYLRVRKNGDAHDTYGQNILTLVHQENRPENKNSCLSGCSISIEKWISINESIERPWIIAICTAGITVFTALAIGVYLYRRRKVKNVGYVVEVENELYGPEYSTEYAEPYEHRPWPPPARARTTGYANVER